MKTKGYVSELMGKTADELQKDLVSAKKELFNLRFQNATNQLDNTARIKEVRKNIARIQTVMTQKAREDAAKERIFSILPEDQKQELISLFDEFEAFETAESKFAHAMDNLQPLMLNNSNGGNDWKEHGVYAEQVYGRQRKTSLGSEKIFEVVDQIIQENIKKGTIKE